MGAGDAAEDDNTTEGMEAPNSFSFTPLCLARGIFVPKEVSFDCTSEHKVCSCP